MAKINFKESISPFPTQKVFLITWVEEDVVKEEPKELNSREELTALLEEVKQFNNDPENKEHGYYQTIISRDSNGKCDKQL